MSIGPSPDVRGNATVGAECLSCNSSSQSKNEVCSPLVQVSGFGSLGRLDIAYSGQGYGNPGYTVGQAPPMATCPTCGCNEGCGCTNMV